MDGDDALAGLEAEGGCDVAIEDLGHLLDLEVMVAGAERAHLLALALARIVRDRGRIGVTGAPVLLYALEVTLAAIAFFQRPFCPTHQHCRHAGVIERYLAFRADAHRNAAKQCLCQLLLAAAHAGGVKAGQMRAHPAGDVEADTAGRDDAALVGIERGYPPIGKP